MTETILISAISAVIGGMISFLLQYVKFKQELKKVYESNKTEYMAEHTARHFLNHKAYTDRSFETLKQHLGGFSDDELRKILVRAGAIRIFRDGNPEDEWWRLLDRMDEYIEKKKSTN